MTTQNVTVYVPKRDRLGRFRSIKWRKLAKKVIIYQLIALSLVMNVWFMRQLYVFRCSAGGMLMTQEKCGELAQNKWDSMTLATVQNQEQELKNNPDLMK